MRRFRFFPLRRKAWLEVELPLAKGRRRNSERNSTIKADIRYRFSEPYASKYCQQFDNFKNVADL